MLANTRTLPEGMVTRCERIVRYTSDVTLDGYLADDLIRDGVERNLIALGEMVGRLRRDDPDMFDAISGSHNILSLRHRIAHGYDAEINDQTIWLVAETSVPALAEELMSLLGSDTRG